MNYKRKAFDILLARLNERRRFIQVLAGPRQSGKTTLARQIAASMESPVTLISADDPAARGRIWMEHQWQLARLSAEPAGRAGALLIIDEIQKVPGWSETVKRLWDEDSTAGINLKVLLLGSATLLIQKGLTESLTGRFEVIRLTHWSFEEMRAAFGWSLDQYVFYGGYPGAADLIVDERRWKRYILDAMIEPTLARDILEMSRVEKPALLRQLFHVGCAYSGQVLSYTKMLGQLQDAGNTTTLAHYLGLLSSAGMLAGLQKYAGATHRQRASSPKLQVLNNAFISAQSDVFLKQARADARLWGRLAESAVGAHLFSACMTEGLELFYWREQDKEVDFIIKSGRSLVAIEVKSSMETSTLPGMEKFSMLFHPRLMLLVGSGGIDIETFLSSPVSKWLG